jgi:hypothetical protein
MHCYKYKKDCFQWLMPEGWTGRKMLELDKNTLVLSAFGIGLGVAIGWTLRGRRATAFVPRSKSGKNLVEDVSLLSNF